MTQDDITQQLNDLRASIQEIRTQAEQAGVMSLQELTHLVQQHQQTLETQGERFNQMDSTVQSIHAQQLLNAQQLAILTGGMIELRNMVADYIDGRSNQ